MFLPVIETFLAQINVFPPQADAIKEKKAVHALLVFWQRTVGNYIPLARTLSSHTCVLLLLCAAVCPLGILVLETLYPRRATGFGG